MKEYKRIMVGLDLSEMDRYILNYLSYINEWINIEKLYFVHVEKEIKEIPSEVINDFPEIKPQDEKIRKEMKKVVAKNFKDADKFDPEYKIVEGNAFSQMLHWTKIKNVDLVLIGNKKTLPGTGLIPYKFARKAPCSVLFIPEKPQLNVKKIFVPIDFSEHAELAMEQALSISRSQRSEVICAHVYKVPLGYYTTGKSYEEFAEIMKGHAVNHYKQFISHMDSEGVRLTPEFLLQDEEDVHEFIIENAGKVNADFLIIGSKGRTAASSILLGSIAEKLIREKMEIPLLIVKKEGENMSFLDALKEL